MTWLHLLSGAAYGIHFVWCFSALAAVVGRGMRSDATWYRVARTLWAELKPWYLPAIAVRHVVMLHGDLPPWVQAALLLLDLWWRWWFRDAGGDDDRWKRRRAKAAAAVRRAGARLTLTPIPAPAPGGA